MNTFEDVIAFLEANRDLPDSDLARLLTGDHQDLPLFCSADRIRRSVYGDAVYIRGLIEVTNYCKNDCYYCGIRCSNRSAVRYRLTKDDILACCREGYGLGFRTFVLQGGEDPYFTDTLLCDIISSIRTEYPDCAITLSLGEKSKESYLAYYRSGANRYLLRHETANQEHYGKLHPSSMSLKARKQCLFDLKEIGYQVGSGFMVGSPYQTTENIISDLRFLQSLQPDMIGIGPYITHEQTPFAGHKNGSLSLTLRLIATVRLIFPHALIPATTALATIAPNGRELGLKAGANVIMPNLSPMNVRALYELYENKICTGEEAAQSLNLLKSSVAKAGYRIAVDIGNVKKASGDENFS